MPAVDALAPPGVAPAALPGAGAAPPVAARALLLAADDPPTAAAAVAVSPVTGEGDQSVRPHESFCRIFPSLYSVLAVGFHEGVMVFLYTIE